MLSMPPAATTSASPSRIWSKPIITALRPEEQTLLTVVAGVRSLKPAFRVACLAGACPTPALSTLPMTTSSTRSMGTLADFMTSNRTVAPNSGAVREARPPPQVPMGVRLAATMTTLFMIIPAMVSW